MGSARTARPRAAAAPRGARPCRAARQGPRQHADVGALGALDLELDVRSRERPRARGGTMLDAARGPRRPLAAARQLVQRLALVLERANHRRDLRRSRREARRARASTVAASSAGTGRGSTTAPSASPVSVAAPSRSRGPIGLARPEQMPQALVAWPKHSGSMPVASGSRVPAWPALAADRACARAAARGSSVRPSGLSSSTMPSTLRHAGRRRPDAARSAGSVSRPRRLPVRAGRRPRARRA